jgi:hypothetical protein
MIVMLPLISCVSLPTFNISSRSFKPWELNRYQCLLYGYLADIVECLLLWVTPEQLDHISMVVGMLTVFEEECVEL